MGTAIGLGQLTVSTLADSGAGSLRDALAGAGPGEVINFDPLLDGQTITLSGGELVIDESLTVDASGLASGLTVDAAQSSRVLRIAGNHQVLLRGLTITGGLTPNGGLAADRNGGGIYNDGGQVTLEDCSVSDNETGAGANGGGAGGNGGGIYSAGGAIILTRCSVNSNRTGISGTSYGIAGRGGGIYFAGTGNLTVSRSSICLNETGGGAVGGGIGGSGGGIFNAGGTLVFENTTIASNTCGNGSGSGNGAGGNGGGVFNNTGSMELSFCTVGDNHSGQKSGTASVSTGGGIQNFGSATLTLDYSIIADNVAPGTGDDIQGNYVVVGKNVVEDDSATPTGSGSVISEDPMLAPLGLYGGPTLTMRLLPGSRAIDATTHELVILDQRGISRPMGPESDLGAVESGSPMVVTTATDENDGGATNELSLRESLAEIESNGIITFDASQFPGPDPAILLLHGQLEIPRSCTIDASGLSGRLTIDAAGQSRVMRIPPGDLVVTLKHLVIIGGRAADGVLGITPEGVGGNGGGQNGGGILYLGGVLSSYGSLALEDCVVMGNHAGDGANGTGGGNGGGIFGIRGKLLLTDCEISENAGGDNRFIAPVNDQFGNGGGVFCLGIESEFDGVFTRCQFLRNSAGNGLPRNVSVGAPGGNGGGAYLARGDYRIEACRIDGNTAGNGADVPDSLIVDPNNIPNSVAFAGAGGNGGGLYFARSVGNDSNIIACSVTHNQAGNAGMPNVFTNCGTVTSSNGGSGGGICYGLDASGTTNIDATTVVGNKAGAGGAGFVHPVYPHPTPGYIKAGDGGHGGGIAATRITSGIVLNVYSSTIVGNYSGPAGGAPSLVTPGVEGAGGGVVNLRPDIGLRLMNNIVAYNSAAGSGPDTEGDFTALGTNLILATGGGTITNPENIEALDPRLAPLGDYGGPTPCMPPLPDSPAIDAASGGLYAQRCLGYQNEASGCWRFYGDPPLAFLDGDGDGTRTADIGAVEYNPATDPGRYWLRDFDGDGVPFGVEQALGTDPLLADPTDPRNLTGPVLGPGGGFEFGFGISAGALAGTTWVLERSPDLSLGSWVEVYAYDGSAETMAPDFSAVFNNPVSPALVTITDENPLIGTGFYRFGARMDP